MPQLAVIVNPTKFADQEPVRAEVSEACERFGWPEARWYETTAEDPGAGQTRQAIADGATVVCPLGGDGTVRMVASVLAGTDTPLGLLPGGTGNLLARNLGLPITSMPEALAVALDGVDRRIDVGRVSFDGQPEEIFLVAAGIGLDAEAVDAPEHHKRVLGVTAYVISGLRSLVKRGFRVTVENERLGLRERHARMVLVGNCGELTGGVALLPDASVDDGRLDVVIASPRGLFGWAGILFDLLTHHHRGHPALQRLTGERFSVRTQLPVQSELDGDVCGETRLLVARCDPGALSVRVPSDPA